VRRVAEDTWVAQDRPILEAVRAAEMASERLNSLTAGAAGGLEGDGAGWAVQDLVEGGFLIGARADSGAEAFDSYIGLRLTERGRRAVGQWPGDPVTFFMAQLDRRIAEMLEGDERTRTQRARSHLGDIAKGVLASALVAVAQAQIQ
jgi:hypothetical protein